MTRTQRSKQQFKLTSMHVHMLYNQVLEAALKRGDYVVNEIIRFNQFHKYRTLRKSYGDVVTTFTE
jgi:hypothetical protein